MKTRVARFGIAGWVLALSLAACSGGGTSTPQETFARRSTGGEQSSTQNTSNGVQTTNAGHPNAVADSMTTTATGSQATNPGTNQTSPTALPTNAATNALAPSNGEFPIAPLHLAPTANAHGEDARVDVELRADGSLYSHGQQIGLISGHRVLAPSGRELVSVAPDGSVSLNGTVTRVRMRENGDVVMPNGAVLTFSPDGTPVAISPDQQSEPGPAHMDGFRPELRRTAALLAVIAATVGMPAPH